MRVLRKGAFLELMAILYYFDRRLTEFLSYKELFSLYYEVEKHVEI